MKLPASKRNKALLIVDVQPAFIKNNNRYLIPKIVKLIKNTDYSLYIDSAFYAEKGSVWDLQKNWTLPKNTETKTVAEFDEALNGKERLSVYKTTRSVFGAETDVLGELKKRKIEEVHIVGVETNDCVFATAFHAFDLGLATYVIEECSDSTKPTRHGLAAKLLREQGMTNHSTGIETDSI